MSVDIRPFVRPEWSPLPFDGCVGVEGRVLVREGDFFIAMLRFPEHATIHEHPGEADTIVVCIEGSGFTSVAGEQAPIAAGQQVRWPKGVPHRLWTDDTTMTTLMVERWATGFGVTPTIRVRDMAEALAFYSGPLEFTVERENEGNSVVKRGDARIMLETGADFYGEEYNAAIRDRLGAPSSISLYIEATDLAAFQSRLEAAGVRIVDPLADRWWGQAELTVEDHEGNWLSFWSPVAAE